MKCGRENLKIFLEFLKPKSFQALIFFVLASFACFELGNTIKKIVLNLSDNIQSFDNPVFSVVLARNTGGAFSILEGKTLLLAAFGTMALLAIFVYVYKKLDWSGVGGDFKSKIELLSCALFFAGVLGNTVERLSNGYVFDYIKLNFINFPVFNFFDILISLAVFLYAIFAIFTDKGKKG